MNQRRSQRYLAGRNCHFQLLEKRLALSATGFGSGIDHGSFHSDPLSSTQDSSLRHPHHEIRDVNQPFHRAGHRLDENPRTESERTSHHSANDLSTREHHSTQHHRRHQDHSGHLQNLALAGNDGVDLANNVGMPQPDHPGIASVLPPFSGSLLLTLSELLVPTNVSPTDSVVTSFTTLTGTPAVPSSIPLIFHFVIVDPVTPQDKGTEIAQPGTIPSDVIPPISATTDIPSVTVEAAGMNRAVSRESNDLLLPTDAFNAKSDNGDRSTPANHLHHKLQTVERGRTHPKSFLDTRFAFEKSRDASFAESIQHSSDSMTSQSDSTLHEKINDLDNLLEIIAVSRATRHPDQHPSSESSGHELRGQDSPVSNGSNNSNVNPMILLSPSKVVRSQLSFATAEVSETIAIEWGVPLGLHRAVTFAIPNTAIARAKAGRQDTQAVEDTKTLPAEPDPSSVEITTAAPHGLGMLCCVMVIPYLRRWYQRNREDQSSDQATVIRRDSDPKGQ